MILTHRGDTAVAEDNSHEAVEAAVQLAERAQQLGIAVGTENDFRTTRDHHRYVCSHYDHLGGTRLSSTAFDELPADCGAISIEHYLSLTEPLPLVNIDHKRGPITQLLDTVQRYAHQVDKSPHQYLVSDFSYENVGIAVEHCKTRRLETPIAWIVESPWQYSITGPERIEQLRRCENAEPQHIRNHAQRVLGLFDQLDADLLHPQGALLSATLINGMRNRAKKMTVWGVNDAELLMYLCSDEMSDVVAHIITDIAALHPLLAPIYAGVRHRKLEALLSPRVEQDRRLDRAARSPRRQSP
jgi:glycerophosphoryl diester phosphodiesterase